LTGIVLVKRAREPTNTITGHERFVSAANGYSFNNRAAVPPRISSLLAFIIERQAANRFNVIFQLIHPLAGIRVHAGKILRMVVAKTRRSGRMPWSVH
jgi:hypothetical protein